MSLREQYKARALLVLGVSLVMLMAASSITMPVSATAPSKGGRLVIARPEDSESLDPVRSGAFASIDVASLIYDSLVTLDMNRRVVGNLAESWSISPDGLVYTFKIRRGIKFHDGTVLDAQAVKAHFDRTIDPATAGRTANVISPCCRAIRVIGADTVQMTLKSPLAPFLGMLTNSAAFGIPSPTAVKKWGKDFGQHPVGTGPFMFKEWVPGDHITLVKNPNYRSFVPYVKNRGAPYLDEVVLRVVPETQSMMAAFQKGEVNLVLLPPRFVKQFQNRRGFTVYRRPSAGTMTNFVEFTYAKPPFDDVRVRKAAAHAIDAQSIIDTVLEGQAIRNPCFMPVGLSGWTEQCKDWGYSYDPAKANSLLDSAGWVKGSDGIRTKDGKPLEILFTTFTRDPFRRIAEVIQAQLAKVGFKVDVQTFEVGTQLAKISATEIESHADFINWGSSDPHLLYFMTHSRQPLGRYRMVDQNFEDVITSTLSQLDVEKRVGLYVEAQKILLQNAAGVPIYSDISNFGLTSNVKDFAIGPIVWSYMTIIVLQDAYVEGSR